VHWVEDLSSAQHALGIFGSGERHFHLVVLLMLLLFIGFAEHHPPTVLHSSSSITGLYNDNACLCEICYL
jgi:hypothetical protein